MNFIKEKNIVIGAMLLSIILIGFFTYKDILNNFYPGIDSITLVDSSRVNSWNDIIYIFKTPGFSNLGASFEETSKVQGWYRPISVLSYSLDYYVWGLNPFGYNLTNLLLHLSVSISIFFLIISLRGDNKFAAWLSAIIFVLHPILIEGVPSPARRHDILATLFFIFSLSFFLEYSRSSFQKKALLVFSVFFYAVSIGAKEITIVLPALIFMYLVSIYFRGKPLRDKLVKSMLVCFPYLLTAVGYFLVRIYVLHGIGGYAHSLGRTFSVFALIRQAIDIFRMYFLDLIYPVDFLHLRELFAPSPSIYTKIGSFLVTSSFILYLFSSKKKVFGLVSSEKNMTLKGFKVISASLAVLTLTSILIYPSLTSAIRFVIQSAYSDEGFGLISGLMNDRISNSVEYYMLKTGESVLTLSALIFVLSLLSLVFMHKRCSINMFVDISDNSRVLQLLLIWLFLPLSVYLITTTFEHHYMYISVVAFSAIISIIFIESLQFVYKRIVECGALDFRQLLLLFKEKAFMKFIVCLTVIGSFISYSPLLRDYGEWEASGKVTRMFFVELIDVLQELPNDAVLNVYNFPKDILSFKEQVPHAKEVAYITGYGIKSWLDLKLPDNNFTVIMKNRIALKYDPDDLALKIRRNEKNNIDVIIAYSNM